MIITIRLSENSADARLCCVRLGSIEPLEMSLLYTFEDNEKKYVAFYDKENKDRLQLRELKYCRGKPKLCRVTDIAVIYQIQAILCKLQYQNQITRRNLS